MRRYLCCRIFVRVAFFVFPTGADAPLKLEALHKNGKRKIAGGRCFKSGKFILASALEQRSVSEGRDNRPSHRLFQFLLCGLQRPSKIVTNGFLCRIKRDGEYSDGNNEAQPAKDSDYPA